MTQINYTPQFKRDYKKLKGKHYDLNKLKNAIQLFIDEKFKILVDKYDDHQLGGSLKSLRALHVEHNKADNWILIYKTHSDNLELLTIDLVPTGSHDYTHRA